MEDQSSFSNTLQVVIISASLHLKADFSTKTFDGEVSYKLMSLTDNLLEVQLDSRDIIINSVLGDVSSYNLSELNPNLGSRLTIFTSRPFNKHEEIFVTINYRTSDKCTAVQFLAPSQTAGKQMPYCYTQCEPIHARTLIPTQDSPGVKFLIDYTINVPNPLVAVAAANPTGKISLENNTTDYKFTQPNPIPSYLIAFAIGNIHSVPIGPRSLLYSEPEMLEAGAYEFGDTESLLSISEEVIGKYTWGKLDLLLLPPSFAYGGMENPTLLFITPSLLAGDRSLTSTIVHEITHSWTGNGVTNSNWENFWLNEGFTVYFERKICAKKFGQGFADIESIIGLKSMADAINVFGESHEYTKLNPHLNGADPDDAYSIIPYEKGCCLLTYLETLVGEELFLNFLRNYINDHLGKSINHEVFVNLFNASFGDLQFDWDTWIHNPGMPVWIKHYDSELLRNVKELFDQWQNPSFVAAQDDVQGWIAQQKENLIDLMLENPSEKYLLIGDVYGISSSHNAEIRKKWLMMVIRLKAEQFYADIPVFLSSTGRMKFIRPVFRVLHSSGLTDLAKSIYTQNKDFYHPTLVSLLEKEFSFSN